MVKIEFGPNKVNFEYIARLPANLIEALGLVVSDYEHFRNYPEDGWPLLADAMAYYYCAKEILRKLNASHIKVETFGTETQKVFSALDEFFEAARAFAIMEQFAAGEESRNSYGLETVVVLTTVEVSDIQYKINELRSLITDSMELNEKHKRRLLARLEKMQAALHTEMSDVDAFLGGILDVSEALGKTAENLSPVAKLFREIFDAIWGRRRRNPEIEKPDYPELPNSSE